jgi:hypothetical protein
MQDRSQGHKVLTDVYYIPELRSNIVSLGQLEEKGFKYVGENGRLCVYDQERTLLISAPRVGNRLYLAKFGLTPPVCLLAQSEDESWRWHARFGHINFRSLNNLSAKSMVDGLPNVKRVERVCDGCVLGKQHRKPFPQMSSFRADHGLELVHADLCGQITPSSIGGASYFLLVVDDHSRYMWVDMLKTKDQALDSFKRIMARAENESGGKLKALRTDRGESSTPICSQFFAIKEALNTTLPPHILHSKMEW